MLEQFGVETDSCRDRFCTGGLQTAPCRRADSIVDQKETKKLRQMTKRKMDAVVRSRRGGVDMVEGSGVHRRAHQEEHIGGIVVAPAEGERAIPEATARFFLFFLLVALPCVIAVLTSVHRYK
jgi:hypothetical protein